MAGTTAAFDTRARRGITALGRIAAWALCAALALVLAAELAFFAIHAAHLLRYPYPLDYGEGPLLAQVDLLRAGTPVWSLYADPGAPPYLVVNYPPGYHLLVALASFLIGNTLLAGRIVSLAATLAAVLALWMLTADPRNPDKETRRQGDKETESSSPSHEPIVGGRSSFVVRRSSFVGSSSWRSWGCRSYASGPC